MIGPGSRAVIETEDAIYSPCEVLAMNQRTVKVRFLAGMKKVKGVQELIPDWKVDVISRDKIKSMSERT